MQAMDGVACLQKNIQRPIVTEGPHVCVTKSKMQMQMQMFLFWFVFFASSCFLVWSSFPGTGAVKIFSGSGIGSHCMPCEQAFNCGCTIPATGEGKRRECLLFLFFSFFTCFLRVGVAPTDFLFPVFDSLSSMQLD